MRRFWICIFLMFLLLLMGAVARAARRPAYSYGLPRQPHRRQTVRPYRLETKRIWSPCVKHRRRRTRDGYDFPNVADTECYVVGGGR